MALTFTEFSIQRDLGLELPDLLLLEKATDAAGYRDLRSYMASFFKYAKPVCPGLNLAEATRRVQALQERGLMGHDLRCASAIELDINATALLSGRARAVAPRWGVTTLSSPYLQEHQLREVVGRLRYHESLFALSENCAGYVVGGLIPERLQNLEPLGILGEFLAQLDLAPQGKTIERECQLARQGPASITAGSDVVRAACWALTGEEAKLTKLVAGKRLAGASVFSEMVFRLWQIRQKQEFVLTSHSSASSPLIQWIRWLSEVRVHGRSRPAPAWSGMKGVELLWVGGVALWEEDFGLWEELRPELRAASIKAAESGWTYVSELFDQLAEDRPGAWRDFLPRSAGWRRRLQGLLSLQDEDPTAAERVIWKLEQGAAGWSAQPYLQKRNKRGWTSGRNFMFSGRPYNLGRQDSRALEAFLNRDMERGWRSLVGHTLLFCNDQPIRLEAGEARLRVTRQNGRIGMRLEPSGVETGLCLHQAAPDRLELVVLPMNMWSVAEALGQNGLSVPEEQEHELTPLLGRLSGSLSIASDVEVAHEGVEERELHRVLYLRLNPAGWGLQMHALIRPFGPDSNAYAANQGPARLVVRLQGRAVQVVREPEWEAALLASLGLEGEGPWEIPDPLACLEFLDRIQQKDTEDLQIEWPEGQSFRLKKPSGQMWMRVESRTDWFELSGGLEVDEGQELRIQQVLEGLRQGHGRFLALSNGEFVALSEEMASRLRILTEVAEPSKGAKMKMHPLTAGLLGNFPDLETDKAFQQQLARIQKVEKLQARLPKTFSGELRGYQLEGYRWLCQRAEWGVGACLADDMGLGKTIQTLALLLQRAKEGPALVVAPTSVGYNWLEEGTRFAPTLRIRDFRQQRSLETVSAGDVVICSYGLLVNEIDRFESIDWATVVLDEAQAIKNPASQRNQAVCRLRADARLATTGTPVENRLEELWALFRFLNPGLLGSQERFRQRFVLPIEAGRAEPKVVLRRLVHPFLLRRTKNEVLRELPPRTEITLEVPQSEEERAIYEALRRQAVDQLNQGKSDPIQVLAELTRLRRACCHASLVSKGFKGQGSKLQTLLALLEELRDGGHRALVFSQFVDHLSLLRKALEKAGFAYQYLDGSTPVAARKQQVQAFQSGQADVFLISLKAGGVGLNLTAADYVIHMDPWWNPAVEDQASDRAHRIGQLRPVTVYRLVAQNTVEDKIVALHLHKRELAQSLLEGSEKPTRMDAQEMLRLIRED